MVHTATPEPHDPLGPTKRKACEKRYGIGNICTRPCEGLALRTHNNARGSVASGPSVTKFSSIRVLELTLGRLLTPSAMLAFGFGLWRSPITYQPTSHIRPLLTLHVRSARITLYYSAIANWSTLAASRLTEPLVARTGAERAV
ncbi:hypothetical protein B296_00009849 [Ensete ventricosum]|uniref:Uncharacterized protein n=1 Tax=Ensete ventricosum TaxID=4639 RepID=A0A427B4Z5_ENSVE|nr:hypothetical protein B296_00009849 [Ensete ventricosum]